MSKREDLTLLTNINPTAGLAERVVVIEEFPWRKLDADDFGDALVSLLAIVLGDGPTAGAAFARALEGAEVLCLSEIRLRTDTIEDITHTLALLHAAAIATPTTFSNEWLLWGIDAFTTVLTNSARTDDRLAYIRAARMAAECFCAGQRLAAWRREHGGPNYGNTTGTIN